MPGKVHVAHFYQKIQAGITAIDTTSRSGQWAGLSPFNLGPCPLYTHPMYGKLIAENMENLWQFAKVYDDQVDANQEPNQDYWDWARRGWADPKPHRYPHGKGAVPLYSLWDGKKLGYIEARKTIYAPAYIKAVAKTPSYQALYNLVQTGTDVALRDYDGYDHEKAGMSLTDVLNNSKRKMGHAFVLKAMLTEDEVLAEFIPTL